MFPEDVASECYTMPCCSTEARLLQTDNRAALPWLICRRHRSLCRSQASGDATTVA